ncbi:hypothetical protein HN873_001323, partial [Arachis hypogaea]
MAVRLPPETPITQPSNLSSIQRLNANPSRPSPSSSSFLSPSSISLPHLRPSPAAVAETSFEATVVIVQLCSTIVQLLFQLCKHRLAALFHRRRCYLCSTCHPFGLESDSSESGVPIELGCACKDDFVAAHK